MIGLPKTFIALLELANVLLTNSYNYTKHRLLILRKHVLNSLYGWMILFFMALVLAPLWTSETFTLIWLVSCIVVMYVFIIPLEVKKQSGYNQRIEKITRKRES